MSSKLVIVESPAKAKTIEKYLPDGYRVLASLGHIRDLPDNAGQLPKKYQKKPWATLGVNVEEDFEPIYVMKEQRAKKAVASIQDELDKADELLLATDEDREGEAISWHLLDLLDPQVPTKRMVFNEITKTAINEALKHTRQVDMNLVAAQETRRILDRLVGYPLSLLMVKKIKYGLSAGRVQSAAVRMIVERERERRRFREGSYWDVRATMNADKIDFQAILHSVDNVRLATGKDFDESTGQIAKGKNVLLLDEKTAKDLEKNLGKLPFNVKDVQERNYSTSPKPPFTTSTLQQEASRKLGMGAKQAMSVAQRLYENGFITYMRTDSTNLSTQAIDAARNAAVKLYGKDYIPEKPRFYGKKAKGAQEAHEAIRPSGDAFVHPDQSGLTGQEAKLYELIWMRTVACQMSDARRTGIRVDIAVDYNKKEHVFRANGNRIDFPGYIRAYFESSDDPDAALENVETLLPDVKVKDAVQCNTLEPLSHSTKPPARYTEASLVRALEEAGIGRPSTYATIMDKITNDGRYARRSGRTLVPTYMAFAVTQLLEENFPELVQREFTAKMEEELDDIAAGKTTKADYLHKFYRAEGAFNDKIERFTDELDPGETRVIQLDDFPATLRVGRYGPYVQLDGEDGETKTVNVPDDIAPADLTHEKILELLEKQEAGPEVLGEHPDTKESVYLMDGRFGPYVQLGDVTEEVKKPPRSSIPKEIEPKDVDLDLAVQLLALPKEIGTHPETQKPILAGYGRYGAYLQHEKDYRNVASFDQLMKISLEEALAVFKEPKKGRRGSSALKELGTHEETGLELRVMNGRYGPYIKLGKLNASLPKETKPEDMTMERALELLVEKHGSLEGATKKTTKKKATTKKKTTAKKTTAKKTTAKKTTAKKTTTKKTTTAKKTTAKKTTAKKTTAKKPAAKKTTAKKKPEPKKDETTES